MRYKITNWDGDGYMNLDLYWKGYELSEVGIYLEEFKLNLKHQLK